MRRAALVVALLVALGACSDDEPNPDWSGVPENQQRLIQQAVDDGDCRKMQTYFDATQDPDLMEYLDWHLDDSGCY
jgi:hypothetical protein